MAGAPTAAQPYRVVRRRPVDAGASSRVEAPVLAAVLLFWAVSVVRVVGAIAGHEVFGGEATLALMVAVGAPWAAAWAYLSARRGSSGAASDPR
jgi:hypothetical protein